ncbi:MAG: hypothetical protein J0I12_16320, partial [Candidatus Eremiobacteraeota bacterium]|nr:hypothetical protein [Candidatus Eremiobacteraeota bacterium]
NFGDDHRLEVYLGQDDRVEYIRGGIARVNGTEISLPLVPVEAKKKLPGSQLLDKDPGRVVLYWPTYQLGAVYYDIGDGWLARYSLGTKPRFLQMSNTR